MEKFNLLVVDDNSIDHRILNQQLMVLGLDIALKSCENGQLAVDYLVEQARQEQFVDLIFLDLNMPILTGDEFLKYYQENFYPQFPHTSIFMLSSSVDTDNQRTVNAYPFVKGFIVKPLLIDPLEELIKAEIHVKAERSA